MHILKRIHNGDMDIMEITLGDIEKKQIELKNDLSRIKQGDPKDRSPEQKKNNK